MLSAMKSAKALVVLILIQPVMFSLSQSPGNLETAAQRLNAGQYKEAEAIYSALTVVSPQLVEAQSVFAKTRAHSEL